MRAFFLGDTLIASCGIGEGRFGWKMFCRTCGETWGTILGLEKHEWVSVSTPCPKHGTGHYTGGSFLRPLVWWDDKNGNSLEKQLDSLDEELLRHEGLMAAEKVLKEKS